MEIEIGMGIEIEYPDREEINASVSEIIRKAYPKRENVFCFLWKLYREVGLADLMHGMEKVMAVLAAVYLGGLEFARVYQMEEKADLSLLAAVLAPFAFQVLLGLFFLEEWEQGVGEVEMTCRYTGYHLLLLRMGIAGIFSAALNGIFFLFYGLAQEEGVAAALRLAFLSVSAFLIYFAVYVRLLLRSVRLRFQVGLFGVWSAGVFLLRFCMPRLFVYLAGELPVLVHVFVWVVLFAGVVRSLPEFVYRNGRCDVYSLVAGELRA